MHFNSLYTILFCCLSLLSQAQPANKFAVPEYSIAHYTDENGLPQNSVKDISTDDYGYVWLASEAGLVRYDGNKFLLFSKAEMGTRHTRVYNMGRWTIGGSLYAVTEGWEYAKVNIDGFDPIFSQRPKFLSDSSLEKHFGKRVLLVSTERFPLSVDNVTEKLLIHSSVDTFYTAEKIKNKNRIQYRTIDHIIWEIEFNKKKENLFLYHFNKKLYLYDEFGLFYLVEPSGLRPVLEVPNFKKLIWNKAEEQAYILTKSNILYSLQENVEGKLKVYPFFKNIPEGFNVESILYLKKENVILLGSLLDGLLICKKKDFNTLYSNLPGENSVFYGIHPYNTYQIITGKAFLLDLTGHMEPFKGHVPAQPANHSSVDMDNMGRIYISEANSLLVYNKDRKFEKEIDMKTTVGLISLDQQGTIWISTRDSGIYSIDSELKPKKELKLEQPIKVSFIKETIKGFMCIGTDHGLYLYNIRTKVLKNFPHTEKYYIRSIFLSPRDKIYLTTYGDGIIMLDHRGLVSLPTDRRGYLKMAHCILQDKTGKFWITTNKGLFCIPEEDLIKYAEGKAKYVYYYHFGKENGFLTNEFNGGCQPCGLKMPDGEMAFPSLNGLVFFNPDSICFNFPKRELQISEIIVNDTSIGRVMDTLFLTRDFKRVEISLTTPVYDADQNIFIDYTMDTTQANSWMPVPAKGLLTFTSAPSGYSTYTFRLNKGFGLSNFSYRTLVIYKPKAFWERPLFWACMALSIAALIYVYLRKRTRNLNERNKMLTEAVEQGRKELIITIDSLTKTSEEIQRKNRFQQWLISSVVHDVRGPLHFINFYGDIKKEDDHATPEKFIFLKSVFFSAKKIYNYSENLIQLLRIEQNSYFPIEKTDFAQLVEDKIEQFREQMKWSAIAIHLHPDSDPFIYVNTTALSIIIQNLLDNSIKNIKQGNIYISLKCYESQSIIEIRDEGPGLSDEQLERFNRPQINEISGNHGSGIGLWLIKSLTQQTEGNITFQNAPTKGLLVTIIWPNNTNDQNVKI
jgi:signal transduction histidine kinase